MKKQSEPKVENFKNKKPMMSDKHTKAICCQDALRLTNDVENLYKYWKDSRSFSFGTVPEGYYRKRFGGSTGYSIGYCPLCGKQFPAELYDYQKIILEREFGLPLYMEDGYTTNPAIPKEFLTDEWWISRQNYSDFPKENKTEFQEDKEKILADEDLTDGEKNEEIEKLIKETIEQEEKEKATDLGDFCCYRFKIWVEGWCSECQGNSCSYFPIIYEPEKRRYRLTNIPPRYVKDKYWRRQPRRELFCNIFYCPRCGTKLPKSLASEWFDQVSKKFGVQSILNKSEMAKVPEKYLTNAWWKELGL